MDWTTSWMDLLREQQAVSLGAAKHHYQEWTGPELEIVDRRNLPVKQVAAMLGRTMYAVRTVRLRMNIDPRKARLAGRRTLTADKAQP